MVFIGGGLVAWQFLEKPIVSKLIDVFVFRTIASFLLDRYLDRKEAKELWRKIKPQLQKEIAQNQDSAQGLQSLLEKYGGFVSSTEPFCTPVLFIVFQQRLIRIISAERLSLMIELFNCCNRANVTIKQLDQTDKEEVRELVRSEGYGPDLSKRKAYYIEELGTNLFPSIIKICDELLSELDKARTW